MATYIRPVAVYRFFRADGVLLYVGITADPWTRFNQHEFAPWAAHADLDRTKVDWYADRATAKAVETAAIKTERPLANKLGAVDDDGRRIAWHRLRWEHMTPRHHRPATPESRAA